MKSFAGSLKSSQRDQIKASLKTAVAKAPAMTRWILVIPKNQTPRMKKGRYSDESWFEDDLPATAPGVELEWWGQDWLDLQASERLDFHSYVEGPGAQLLQRAKEYRMESEAMAAGGLDLFRRNATLRKRADEISMYWRLSYLVTRSSQISMLEEKYPGAANDDPVVLRPTFSFDLLHDENAAVVRAQLERTLAFGGRVEVPERYIESFEVDASEEARLLLAVDQTTTTSLSIESVRTPLDPPVAGFLSYSESDDDAGAGLDVYFRERTGGSEGVTLWGGDASGLLSIETVLPHPPSDHVDGSHLQGTLVSFETRDLAGHPLEPVAALVDLVASARTNRKMRLEVGTGIGSWVSRWWRMRSRTWVGCVRWWRSASPSATCWDAPMAAARHDPCAG